MPMAGRGASCTAVPAPAWYQSPWFLAACIVLLLSVLASSCRARIRQVRTQARMHSQARLLEREHIAHELHDALIQGVQGLVLSFHVAMGRLSRGQDARAQMEEALAQAEQLLAEARDRVRGLRESMVYQGDLAPALAEFASDLALLHPASFSMRVQGEGYRVHPVALEDIFLVAREALSNAFRHARAPSIEVEIDYGPEYLRLSVCDDGQGIAPAMLAAGGAPGHWGLRGMHERASRLGGKLHVRSCPGAGTRVVLEVPATVARKPDGEDGSPWRRP